MGEILISVAIVGCGEIAFGYSAEEDGAKSKKAALDHARALLEAGGFDLIACVDPFHENLKRAENVFPNAKMFGTLEELRISDQAIDLMVISSPTEYHEQALEYAISHRIKAVFCEKPITDSPTKSAQFVRDAAANGIELSVNLLRLWDSSMEEIRTRISKGEFGSLQSGSAVIVKDITHNGPHMVALLSDLLGDVVLDKETTAALIRNGQAKGKSGPCACLSVGDRNIYLSIIDHHHYNFFELELFFEKAVVRLEDGGRRIVIRKPVPHPDYAKFLYPEDISVIEGHQRTALINAWSAWRAFFEQGTPMRKDVNWILRQEMICHQIKALM
ncbi:Gfo/Idh/MocA family protein [Thalassospira povalilytica]|uniref:Gfo/Idh/MocA family protein n=1 Tax=Thalassospira povalilytica TaxID=732237 RepID=UPI001D17FC28|nr:Gfo/Idh/MocA family oxidoreductase [Thalassospira povalilytica]MCC4241909.1 Gfo/Idh/MocA family oxidoreductase [Thalassospira povalilytica]